jgi:DUF4097 and DUF4098 domain-containing protein YvlB
MVTKLLLTSILLALNVAAFADTSRVNGAITIAANQQAGDVNTVNGAISVGEHATAGEVATVNGAVTLSSGARAASVATVNGQIQLHGGAQVSGDVTVVNGAIVLDKDAEVGGNVTTVNGPIQTRAVHVARNLETVNGTIEVGADSRIDGGITVHKRGNSWFSAEPKPIRVVIGPRAVVKGALKFERPVRLYVSSSATTGSISGAQVIRFSGERAPE